MCILGNSWRLEPLSRSQFLHLISDCSLEKLLIFLCFHSFMISIHSRYQVCMPHEDGADSANIKKGEIVSAKSVLSVMQCERRRENQNKTENMRAIFLSPMTQGLDFVEAESKSTHERNWRLNSTKTFLLSTKFYFSLPDDRLITLVCPIARFFRRLRTQSGFYRFSRRRLGGSASYICSAT